MQIPGRGGQETEFFKLPYETFDSETAISTRSSLYETLNFSSKQI